MTFASPFEVEWETVVYPVVPYPASFAEVLAGRAFWKHGTGVIDYLGPRDAGGVRYVRDLSLPPDLGEGAWRRHDPAHSRCWYCGKFVSPKAARYYTVGCPDCGEWKGGPW